MKLLITTQKIDKNDSVLGFFHRWVAEFAKHCEKVTVICLEKGEYELPSNVEVISLGKEERKKGYIVKLLYGWRFFKYAWFFRKNYDQVFVHMNPEYVVLGGWLWKIMNKKISLWYVHRQVNLKLRIATLFCNKIFSVSSESFRLKSKKVNFVGHGVDIDKFTCKTIDKKNDLFTIISVGRITRIKNLGTLIKAVAKLSESIKEKIVVELVGDPVTRDDKSYLVELKKIISSENLTEVVKFVGAVPYSSISEKYCTSDLSVNLAPTGGMDKAVLEAMSCGVITLFANDAFVLVVENKKDILQFDLMGAEDLADRMTKVIEMSDDRRQELSQFLRSQIADKFSLEKLINNLVRAMS